MLGDQAKSTKYTFWEHFLKQKILNNGNVSLHGRSFKTFKGKGKLSGKLGGKRMARGKGARGWTLPSGSRQPNLRALATVAFSSQVWEI